MKIIIVFLGGVGSGKSLSCVRQIIKNNKFAYTNFKLKNFKKFHRIKYEDIINKVETDSKNKGDQFSVNWDFWDKARKQQAHFDIALDEIHNIIHSRSSMSITNRLMSKWVSQIRKITSDNEYNNLYLISQKVRKIDVDFRELAHIFIDCKKIRNNKGTFIMHSCYEGIEGYENGQRMGRYYFKADPWYKYYNTLEMVKFGDSEEYI